MRRRAGMGPAPSGVGFILSVFQLCLRLSVLAAAATLSGHASADVFKVSYQDARVESITAAEAGLAGRGSVLGIETFDRLARGDFMAVPSFKTAFGTAGVLTGMYSGAMGVNGADQYGGAGGTGNYIVTFDRASGYTLDLGHNGSIPGFNYFGLQLSALDGGNRLEFRRAGQTVFSYMPDNLIKSLGTCGGNAYCGNPTTGANDREQYAFVSFLNLDSTFDQVWFRQSGGGGLETDNHTVGYRAPETFRTAAAMVEVPEPVTAAMLGTGLLALGLLRARRARNPG